ncbi:MAG: substrate-binding domain-containing protein, partial [Acidimicrobiales bacterium]
MPEPRRQSDDRLRLTRLARGLSQGSLASTAGVTRQAISGIESGRWSPSLDVALLLAKALDASVEDLFGSAAEATPVTGRLAGTRRLSTPAGTGRFLLSEVAGETVAYPLAGDSSWLPGFVPALATVVPGAGDQRATVRTRGRGHTEVVDAVRIAPEAPALAVAGCDPALALLQGPLRHHEPAVYLAWHPCGNAAALDLLESGTAHVACLHRRAELKRRRRPGYEVVGFASWREGLAVSRRLRGRVRSLEDAVRHGARIANRDPGSEARRLLDDELQRLRLDGSRLAGYDSVCGAHLLVTSAIASGLADIGITTEPAALAYELDFIPWQHEISELHVPRSMLGCVEVRALLD